MIPFVNLSAQYEKQKPAIDAAISQVVSSGVYINGPHVGEFEKKFAEYIGIPHAIGVASGTDAIRLSLIALGIMPGDEVVTVSHTAVATISAITQTGASPVLVDILPGEFTMNPLELQKAITSKTKAVIAVHLYGAPCELDAIIRIASQRGIPVIEDCCQSHGAKFKSNRVGSFGITGAFSFYPTKNLGAFGDGGMITTSSSSLASKLRQLREYGWKQRFISETEGVNSRLDELQAAILSVKIERLDEDNAKREKLATRYSELLRDLPLELPKTRENTSHVFHLFVIRTKNRNALQRYLFDRGIQTAIHYPVPVHLQPAYRGRIRTLDMSNTEHVCDEILSLPMHAELTESDIETVGGKVAEWVRARD